MEHRGQSGVRPGGVRPGSVALTLVAALALVSPAAAQSSLKSRRDVATGNHPVGAVALDYDNDGLLDLVSVDQMDDVLGLLKGFGDGTFRRVGSVPAGSLPTGVVAADLNGDGRLDLIASNLRSQEITTHFSDGQGGFLPKISSLVFGFTMTGITLGDWNGDGRLDAAVISSSLASMTILIGDGTGRFTSPVQVAVAASPKSIVTADFNRDGKADLAVAGGSAAAVQIWRGDGTGAFTLQATLSTGTSPQGLAAGDLDADGDPDLVVCNYGSDNVGVYLNNGTGTFAAPALLTPGFGPRTALIADINKDGKADLFVTLSKVSGVGQAATLFGNGSGGFGSASVINTGPVPNTATSGDFNRDDNVDFVTVNLTGNTVSILQNIGSGAFLFGGKVTLPAGAYPRGLVSADLNRDGKADLAAANQALDNVSVSYGDGLGGFSAPGPAIRVGTTPYGIAAADFNRDNNVDLITANFGSDSLTYMQGTGTGFATYAVTAGCAGPVAVAADDISGDLIPDHAAVCETSAQMCTHRGTGMSGNFAFGAAVCTALTGTPSDIVLANVNGDAFADAAIASSDLNTVTVALSNGVGGVNGVPSVTPVGAMPEGVARADLNGDGLVDLVVANTGSNTVSAVLAGSPVAIDSPAGLGPASVALADFNMDGKIDAAVANTDDNNVSLLLGDGAGRFSSAGFFGTRDLPVTLETGDFNRDGKPDLAVTDSFSDSVTILLNQSWTGDPLQWVSMFGGEHNVMRWGLLPGAVYDVIRGDPHAITQAADHVDLGPVLCLGNDITDTDTANYPDPAVPAPNEAFFYLVRSTVGGVAAGYTVATNGKIGIPASGDCD